MHGYSHHKHLLHHVLQLICARPYKLHLGALSTASHTCSDIVVLVNLQLSNRLRYGINLLLLSSSFGATHGCKRVLLIAVRAREWVCKR